MLAHGQQLTIQEEPTFVDQVRKKVAELTVRPNEACGYPFDRPWIRVSELKAWMLTKLEDILHEVHGPRFGYHDTKDNSKEYLLILAILLTIDDGKYGKYIAHFKSRQVTDAQLPLDASRIRSLRQGPDESKQAPEDEWDQMTKKFHSSQWRFKPLQFSLSMERVVEARDIVPICHMKEIKQGGTAVVWQVLVPEEFVDSDIARIADQNPHGCAHMANYGKCYQFALKTFDQTKAEDYRREKDAYSGLRDHSGMIQYLGSFDHTRHSLGNTTTTTFSRNILLEFSDLDLDAVLYQRNPPGFPKEIKRFWEALSAVADALHKLHGSSSTANSRGAYYGWHADIKPSNILSVEGKYKLADLGFARFVERDKFPHHDLPKTSLEGGTDTYGAPERLSASQPVSQKVDTWSLGCVLSLAATWIVFGVQGTQQYDFLRSAAIEKILVRLKASPDEDPQHPFAKAAEDGQKSLDVFHDGRRVLPEVTQWHDLLRVSSRANDELTPKILDLVDKHLLQGNEKTRASAAVISNELKKLLATHQVMEMPAETDTIVEMLIDLDSKLPLTVDARGSSRSLPSDTRKERKSKLMSVQPALIRTSHRSEHRGFGRSNQLAKTDVRGKPIPSPIDQWSSDVDRRDSQPRTDHRPSLAAHRVKSTDSDASTSHVPQNVIQAYYQNKKNTLKGKLTRRDPDLKPYFTNRDRDIMFLADNATSMAQYWQDAMFLLDVIAAKVSGYDSDGLDLRFIHNANKHSNVSSKQKVLAIQKGLNFREAMEKVAPNIDDIAKGVPATTDMADALNGIFRERLAKLSSREKQKKFTLIVLTDGRWERMENKDNVRKEIKQIMKAWNADWKPRKSGTTMADEDKRSRPVSITFVQFGQDQDAFMRLRQLDNELIDDEEFVQEKIGDVVDHEMFEVRGDVNKIILGSFEPSYDAIDRDAEIERSIRSESSYSVESRRSSMMPSPTDMQPTRTSINRSDSSSTVIPSSQIQASTDPLAAPASRGFRSALSQRLSRSNSSRSRSR